MSFIFILFTSVNAYIHSSSPPSILQYLNPLALCPQSHEANILESVVGQSKCEVQTFPYNIYLVSIKILFYICI